MTPFEPSNEVKYNARATSYAYATVMSILAAFALELGYRCQMDGRSFYAGYLYLMGVGLVVLAIANILMTRSRNRYSSEGAEK